MSTVKKVHTITEQLFQLVSEPILKDERDKLIEQITSLLEKREDLLPDINAPFSREEKALSQQIIAWNKVISVKFSELMQQIQQDMGVLSVMKKD